MSRKLFPGALLTPRRFFMRPWRLELGGPQLIGGILCTLFISYFGAAKLVPFFGAINSAVVATAAGALFLTAMACLTSPRGFVSWKTGFRKIGVSDLKLAFAALIVVLTGSAVITGIWQQMLDHLQIPFEKEQLLVQLARTADAATFCKLLLLTAVAVPLTEELMFRRFLYELLQGLGHRTAFFATAFIFAAAHGFLLGMPGLFFMGMIFQILCNTTRNLWTSVICHSLLNASVLIITRTAATFISD